MGALAIIVVAFNSAESIDGLLASVRTAWPSGEPEVIVVDNDSTDNTRELVGAHSDVRLVRQPNAGYAAGVNTGVAAAPAASAYFILNADVRLGSGCVPPLLAAVAEPGVGIAAPLVVTPEGGRQDSLRRQPSLPRALGLNWTRVPLFSEYVTGDAAYQEPGDVDWALGAALMFSRGCYEAIGPWDESFFLYSEETDFCLRARDRGWRTRFVPDSTVMHQGGGSGRSAATHQMLILNKVRLYARRHSRAAAWAYWAATIASEATWLLRGQAESRAAIRALVHPAERPAMLGLRRSVLPL